MKTIPLPQLGFLGGVFLANHWASNGNLTRTTKSQNIYQRKLTTHKKDPNKQHNKKNMLRHTTDRPGLVAFYSIRPGKGGGLFLQTLNPQWPTVCQCISPSTQDWTFRQSIRLFFSTLVTVFTVRVGEHNFNYYYYGVCTLLKHSSRHQWMILTGLGSHHIKWSLLGCTPWLEHDSTKFHSLFSQIWIVHCAHVAHYSPLKQIW